MNVYIYINLGETDTQRQQSVEYVDIFDSIKKEQKLSCNEVYCIII